MITCHIATGVIQVKYCKTSNTSYGYRTYKLICYQSSILNIYLLDSWNSSNTSIVTLVY